MSYIMNKDDVIQFALSNGMTCKTRGDEIDFSLCPYCGGGGHKDKKTFSVNYKTGAFCCFRSSCGKKGHFVEMCRDFDYELDFGYEKEKKNYKKWNQVYKRTTPSDRVASYFQKRGISEEIISKYGIKLSKIDRDYAAIPHYDENGELQIVKARFIGTELGDKSKEFFAAKNQKPILFGMYQCDPSASKTLIITEGQIDALSLSEAGIPNACSVPNGAKGFTWIEHCKKWIYENFDEIIVFGDNEKGKITLVDEIRTQLITTIKVVRVQDYLGEKDANDILLKYGKEALQKCIENAEKAKIPHIINLSDVEDVDSEKMPRILTGIKTLDDYESGLGGLFYGQVILLTGKSGQGKSTIASQFMCEALDQGLNVLGYSGELPNYRFKEWINQQLIGTKKSTREQKEKVAKWYNNRAFLFDNRFTENDADVIKLIEQAVKAHDIKFVLVDNLMTLVADYPSTDDIYRQQSDITSQLVRLAVRLNIVIVFVAHLRKSGNNSKNGIDNDDVLGSSDIVNKVDVVMNYSRGEEKNKLKVTKNRLNGNFCEVELTYNPESRRSLENEFDKVYRWNSPENCIEIETPNGNRYEEIQEEDLPF